MNEKNSVFIDGKSIRIFHFDTLPSTNDFLKEKRGERTPYFALANRQTGGRGTKGRSFSSNQGGVYLSALKFYENFSAERAFEIMAGAAVAVCKTLQKFGLSPVIKWPNDIHAAGKKICGILIENTFSGRRVDNSVIGVGINVNNSLPDTLSTIATTMQQEGAKASCDEVSRLLMQALYAPVSMQDYLSFLGYMQEEAILLIGDERIPATLLFVDEVGRLHVRMDGEERCFTSAEVSVRGVNLI